VKIGYWDISASKTPRIVGEVRGTPTIKFLYPSKKNGRGSNKKKIVSDYNGERKWKDMATFAAEKMPNYVMRIKDDSSLKKFEQTAFEYALPTVMVFSEKPTNKLVKALSTEWRRRVLIGSVRASKNNKDIITKFGVTKFPTVIALKKDGKHVTLEKKPSWKRLNSFMSDHALEKPYFEDPVAQAELKARKGAEEAEL